uniref:Uncharacterized protein n=1 Tax=Nelumbo nucifera TaxID=4432 RepID=A0A822ZKC1_NELNU|nr:TPA_asm: hypothetical protein HUJ06_003832 [Nelumbo nucifera]
MGLVLLPYLQQTSTSGGLSFECCSGILLRKV